MVSFKDQSFQRRFAGMGDEAEAVFERVYPRGWARYGLSRPRIALNLVPAFIRFTPDYVTSHGLVEVQGFGTDQVCKFKTDKIDALTQWSEHFPVTLFLYDKTNQRYGYMPLGDVTAACQIDGELKTFPEGATYWAIPAANLGIDWTDL